MKTISDLNFRNKTVLLRTDINSDIVNGRVLMSERIRKSAETIKELKKKKAKVVILAHQGRPGENDFIGLKEHARLLNRLTKIEFVPDIIGERALNKIRSLKPGKALLLENIRFLKDEFEPDKRPNKIIENLVPLSDIYVNDAFSVCHRNHTSITEFPNYLQSCAGRILEKEVNALKKIKIKNKSTLFILGGAKPEDNIRLLKVLKESRMLTCGLFGQLCLIAKGKNLGAQNKYLKDKLHLIDELKKAVKNSEKVSTPVDFGVKVNGKRKELALDGFPSRYEIYDIGRKTIDRYLKEIEKSKTIFMKGPAGDCGINGFCVGTAAILRGIARNKGFSLIGGGHLNDAIKKSGINRKKFGYISLSGGALVRYIAGEKLPGLEALRWSKVK